MKDLLKDLRRSVFCCAAKPGFGQQGDHSTVAMAALQ
jgi:hypothetical protein